MAMRMNQQYHQRTNGLGAKGKLNKNGESNNMNHGQRNPRHTSSTNKQEFKPVAILKRGESSVTTVVNKEENSLKENIATHGQPAKTIIQRVRYKQSQTEIFSNRIPLIFLANFKSSDFIIVKTND